MYSPRSLFSGETKYTRPCGALMAGPVSKHNGPRAFIDRCYDFYLPRVIYPNRLAIKGRESFC